MSNRNKNTEPTSGLRVFYQLEDYICILCPAVGKDRMRAALLSTVYSYYPFLPNRHGNTYLEFFGSTFLAL